MRMLTLEVESQGANRNDLERCEFNSPMGWTSKLRHSLWSGLRPSFDMAIRMV